MFSILFSAKKKNLIAMITYLGYHTNKGDPVFLMRALYLADWKLAINTGSSSGFIGWRRFHSFPSPESHKIRELVIKYRNKKPMFQHLLNKEQVTALDHSINFINNNERNETLRIVRSTFPMRCTEGNRIEHLDLEYYAREYRRYKLLNS